MFGIELEFYGKHIKHAMFYEFDVSLILLCESFAVCMVFARIFDKWKWHLNGLLNSCIKKIDLYAQNIATENELTGYIFWYFSFEWNSFMWFSLNLNGKIQFSCATVKTFQHEYLPIVPTDSV